MSQSCVVYQTYSPIDKVCSTPSEVILCVSPQVVARVHCPEDVGEYEVGYIRGVVLSITRGLDVCGKPCNWKYTICYALSQIAEGFSLLPENVLGVVGDSCLIDWVSEVVGNEVYIRNNEDGTLTLVSQHGCEYTFNTEGVMPSSAFRTLDGGVLGQVVKNTPGEVTGIYAFNLDPAVPAFLKLYDQPLAPDETDIPIQTYPLPYQVGGAGAVEGLSSAITFAAGISFRVTTGAADNDVGAPAANTAIINILYR